MGPVNRSIGGDLGDILCDLKSYEDTSPSYVLFREGEGAGDDVPNFRTWA